VASKSSTQSTITTGPYTSAAEAKQALQRMGAPLNGSFSQTAPFVVRIGPYADRAGAETASAGLTKQGVINIVTDDASYAFSRSGPLPNAEGRSEEHTSELQSRRDIVCRLLLEKK